MMDLVGAFLDERDVRFSVIKVNTELDTLESHNDYFFLFNKRYLIDPELCFGLALGDPLILMLDADCGEDYPVVVGVQNCRRIYNETF